MCPLEKVKIQVLQTTESNQHKFMVNYRGKHSKWAVYNHFRNDFLHGRFK